MVYKRGKRIELRKRKETEKEKKAKERQKKVKAFKEAVKNYRLSLIIYLLMFANLLFIISIVCHSFAIKGTSDSITPGDSPLTRVPIPQKMLQVEVLNGCNVPGIARQLTEYLRRRNIDVVYYGNFESRDISETLIIDRRQYDLKNAKIIARILGVEQNRIFPQISPQRQLDVTIIIGKNYSDLKAFK